MKRQIARRRLAQPRVDADAGEVAVRREVHRLERVAAARLEIDGLPHPVRRAVALLPLELERVRGVVDADDETQRLREAQALRELAGEWRVSTLVLANLLSVDPRH